MSSTLESGGIRPQMPYLPYLEGLRGLAALYVAIYHIRLSLDNKYAVAGPASALLPGHGFYLYYGHSAVTCFIIVSGYVLTLPLARRHTYELDFFSFMKKRLRRLLPAYYASLFILLPLYFVNLHQLHTSTSMSHLAGQLVTHVLLIHNLTTRTIFGIQPPLWSIATEMQIYVVFALFILPLQKRVGLLIATLLTFALGLIPTAIGELRQVYEYPLYYASFWLVGLFACGSVAAWIGYGPDKYTSWQRRVPWNLLSLLGLVLFVLSIVPDYGAISETLNPLQDILLGLCIVSGMIAISASKQKGKSSFVERFFALPPFVWLGTFSYSLYLIHDPIEMVVTRWAFSLAPSARVLIDFGMLPVIVVLAYGFARIFEFPFISTFRKQNDERAIKRPASHLN